MGNYIAKQHEKNERNKKIDNLYKECLYIYDSMKANTRVSDITPLSDPKGANEEVNVCFREKNSQDNRLMNEFENWKASINYLKPKLRKNFGERGIEKADKFSKILNLIEGIITMQEETAKRIKYEKEKELEKETDVKLSDLAIQFGSFDQYSNTDYNLYSDFAENANLDYKNLQTQIHDLMQSVTNEINKFLDETIVATDNNKKPSSGSSKETLPKVEPIPQKGKEDEIDILMRIGPQNIFFGGNDSPKTQKEISGIFEARFGTNKSEILPRYNYAKLLGSELDLNSVDYNFENIYFKVFVPVIFNDHVYKSKRLLGGEFDMKVKKTHKNKSINDIEANVQYDNFTPLQKVTFLWAISYYGNNSSVIREVVNMFTFSKNIDYSIDEVNYICEKILEEVGVDPQASSLNFYSTRFFDKINDNIESPIQISTTSNFNYSQQLKDFFSGKIQSMKLYKEIPKKYNLPIYYFGNVKKSSSNSYTPVSFILNNPLLRNNDIKRKLANNIKEQIMKICKKVETLNSNNISKYDYFKMEKSTGHNRKVNDLSGYPQIKENSERKLDKNLLLAQFANKTASDLGFMKESTEILEEQKNRMKKEEPHIMEFLSFTSVQGISKEWENLRTPWYQNNTEFSSKFKKTTKQDTRQKAGGQMNQQ